MAANSKEIVRGAYVLVPREEPAAKALGIFDWSLRDMNVPAPAAQNKVADLVRDFGNTLREHLPFDSKNPKVIANIKRYNDELSNIFQKGCVWEKPQPDRATKDLEFLREKFIRSDLSEKLRGNVTNYTFACVLAAAIFAALAYYVKNIISNEALIPMAAYLFVVAASMLGIVVSNLAVPAITKVSEYEAQSRLLSLPVLRIIGSAAVAVVIAILLQHEGITFKLAKFDASKIEDSVETALAVGFLVGIGSSDAIKMLIGLAKRNLK